MAEKLNVMFLTAEDSMKVFRQTEERINSALERFPDFKEKINVNIVRTTTSYENTPSWNEHDHELFFDAVKDADIMVGYMFPLDNIKKAAPRLKYIHIIGAGIEHLTPLTAWLPEDIILTNNRGAHAPKSYEYVMMSLLALANHLPRLATAQRAHKWDGHFLTIIKGKTVAILGCGKQGQAAARAAKVLGLKVLGVDLITEPRENFDEIVGPEKMYEILGRADFTILTLPLTKETERMFGRKEFDAMKDGAGFINICRGKIVRTEALIEALESGKISGAVLDVFDQEPLPPTSPLWDAPNLLMTPHMGCDDEENYIDRTYDIVFENLRRLEKGVKLENVVDRQKGY